MKCQRRVLAEGETTLHDFKDTKRKLREKSDSTVAAVRAGANLSGHPFTLRKSCEMLNIVYAVEFFVLSRSILSSNVL